MGRKGNCNENVCAEGYFTSVRVGIKPWDTFPQPCLTALFWAKGGVKQEI